MPLGVNSWWALCLERCVSLGPLRRRNLGLNGKDFITNHLCERQGGWGRGRWEGWECPWCKSMMHAWPLVKRRESSLGGSSLDCYAAEESFRKAFGESRSQWSVQSCPWGTVIGQVQPIGSEPSAQTLGWISEAAAQLCSLSLEAFLLAFINAFPLPLNSSCLYLKGQL